VIVVPNVTPRLQRELFQTVLSYVGERELLNTVVEVEYRGDKIRCRQYPLPSE
jgi:hypothetical protein